MKIGIVPGSLIATHKRLDAEFYLGPTDKDVHEAKKKLVQAAQRRVDAESALADVQHRYAEGEMPGVVLLSEPLAPLAFGIVVAEYKIGVSKGKPRIWIDGKKLKDAGFVGGTIYGCGVSPGRIRCHLRDKIFGNGSINHEIWCARKVTGRPDGKPIIDMVGADVERAFPGGVRVRVTFKPGLLLIEEAR